MRNQPKYRFFKNWSYAISGFFEVVKNETAFKIELVIFILLTIFLFNSRISTDNRLIMLSCFFLVIIVELLNSAIERCVDLITEDFHELAKAAKDAAAGAVMFANFITFIVWIYYLFLYYAPHSL